MLKVKGLSDSKRHSVGLVPTFALSVRLSPMANAINNYSFIIVKNLIKYAIVTDSDTIFGLAACEFDT